MKMFFEQMANVPATSFSPNYIYEKRGLTSPLSMPICMGILISPFYCYLNH